MAGNRMSVVAMACLIALIQISSSAATPYTVGDTTGWTDPSDSSLYTNWVSGKTFNAGDTLLFSFSSGHTVSEVSKSEYTACSSSKPISSKSTGPVTVTLTSGDHYYICQVPGHCDAGQKLAVTVGSSSTAPTPSSSTTPPSTTTESPPPPSTTTTTPSPPPPSSSPAVVAGLAMPFLIGAAAFFL